MRRATEEGLENAVEHGNEVKLVVLKVVFCFLTVCNYISTINIQTDRPRTEYWNSGLVQALRDLAMEFKITFVHFTEQSHHNKVFITMIIKN